MQTSTQTTSALIAQHTSVSDRLHVFAISPYKVIIIGANIIMMMTSGRKTAKSHFSDTGRNLLMRTCNNFQPASL